MFTLSPFFVNFMFVVSGMLIGSSVTLMHVNYTKALEKSKENTKKEENKD